MTTKMLNQIDFLHDLVAIESVSGNEAEAVQFMVSAMSEMGYDEAFIDDAGNAVGVRGQGEQTVVLLGHIDTVPGNIVTRIEDGVLHGRGSVDAKGPLAAFVIAGAQAEIPENMRLIVTGAVEEEASSSKGAHFVKEMYQPDFCIIGEPSGWDGVTLGYKGICLVDISVEQDMFHTAGDGVNSAEIGLQHIEAIKNLVAEYNQDKDSLFSKLMFSIRDIHTSSDGTYDRIDIRIGLRLPPNFDMDDFAATIKTRMFDDVSFHHYLPACVNKRSNRLAKLFGRAILQAGEKPRFKHKTGTSDMNVVVPVWNCPTVAYGPGDSTLDHAPDEQLVLTEYQKAIEILTVVLERL